MKKTNTEIMKELRTIARDLDEVLELENQEYSSTYEKDEEIIEITYKYELVRKIVDELHAKQRKYKALLAYSNATTIVPEYNMTIGECLVYLAQLSEDSSKLYELSRRKPLSRRSTAYGVEYVKLNYDVETAKKDYREKLQEISRLQMAIDRVNLTNEIEC